SCSRARAAPARRHPRRGARPRRPSGAPRLRGSNAKRGGMNSCGNPLVSRPEPRHAAVAFGGREVESGPPLSPAGQDNIAPMRTPQVRPLIGFAAILLGSSLFAAASEPLIDETLRAAMLKRPDGRIAHIE